MTALQKILSRLRGLLVRQPSYEPSDCLPLDLVAAQARLQHGGYLAHMNNGRLVASSVEHNDTKGWFYRDVVLHTQGDLKRFLKYQQFV